MDGKGKFSACLLLILALSFRCSESKETEVRAHAGTDVTLPCRVDIQQCGTLHSVKWYRDTSRIYVFSKAGQVARAEGDATERMSVQYDESGNETLLKISPVEVEDEATYKCEITYLEVRENCDVVQIVKLTTLVKPTSVRILGNDGVSIANDTKLAPKNEGSEIVVICEAMGGKPIPTVTWYNGTQPMNRASYSTHGNSNGVGTGVSKLQITLSRGDLDARFECKVNSQALDEPIISWITVDVNVKPTKIEVTGGKGQIAQGVRVMLICDVFNARPAATVKWFNGTDEVNETLIQTIPDENRDGTFTTKSSLVFTATRWENGRTFKCIEENEVTKSMQLPGLYALQVLDIRFPPVIKISTTKTVLTESENIMLSCTYYANPQKLLAAAWLKDGKNITRVKGKHENGNIESPSLHIRNITRDDMGEYTCWLKNEVGETVSEETIYLDVHYPPDVEVIMEPSTPVKAVDRGNVTLECNVTSGNPPALRKVRWYLGGELMTELPECNYTQTVSGGNESLGGPFCGIDPSILSLIKVEESFAGNYTCQGENEAGWGPVSEPQELVVYYPPSPAKLTYLPTKVMKKGSVNLTCTVDHTGRPDNVTYLWYRGGYEIRNITVSQWTIPEASLTTRSNFTCIAMNEGGQSVPDTKFINVLAPPSVIGTSAKSYKGVLYSSTNVSLTCHIECFPLCSIIWFKDRNRLNTQNNKLYYVNVTEHPADYNKNDFESIESTLVWNISSWPNQQLNKSAPPSEYTCESISTHDVGTHVSFTTEIAIDFPPEELTVSKHQVNVIENEIPDSVKCSGKGRPKLNYVWKKNSTFETIVKDDTLQLDKMTRSDRGYYVCEAYNKYGNRTIPVYFDVLYKPVCVINIGELNGESALICEAEANPQDVTFSWKIREANDTVDYDNAITKDGKSYLVLDSTVDTYRTYLCIANNSVGASIPCDKYVPGSIPWYKRLGRENLIIIIASIIALIICVIVVCIVIIVLCRKKREHTKSPNPSSTGDKMRLGAAPPVGGSADPANDHDKGFYENLPFHGMQNPPNKPYRPDPNDFVYADVDCKYGPIDYKGASIYAAMKRNKNNNNKLEEVNNKPYDDLL